MVRVSVSETLNQYRKGLRREKLSGLFRLAKRETEKEKRERGRKERETEWREGKREWWKREEERENR